MGQERNQAYGFGLSRDAHIAFASAYIAILVTIGAFGSLRFVEQLAPWRWPQLLTEVNQPKQKPQVANRASPAPDPATPHRMDFYPSLALRNNEEGSVTLRILVLHTGQVGDVQIVKSSGHPQLDAAALLGVDDWRYLPAVRNGKPVDAETQVVIRFLLQKN